MRAAQDNYADTTKFICATKTCVLNRNTFVNRSATPPAPWPAAAQAVMAGAGVRPEARSQMHPDAAGSCRSVPGLKTDDTKAAPAFYILFEAMTRAPEWPTAYDRFRGGTVVMNPFNVTRETVQRVKRDLNANVRPATALSSGRVPARACR